jgi:beta-lactamase class C
MPLLSGLLMLMLPVAGHTDNPFALRSSLNNQHVVFQQFAPDQLPQPVHPASQLDFSRYHDWLAEQLAEKAIPGMAVAIVSSRGILDIKTWGVRSIDDQLPVTDSTVFRIASVSKTFAGTVAAQLVHHNIYGWDEPIASVLPQYSIGTEPRSRQMTLRHVLSHTTGLMPHAFSNLLDAGVAYQKIQEKFHEIPTVCDPGRCYGYQNVVFSLVADMVEAGLQTSYDDFVRENIFAPLGMLGASMGYDDFAVNPDASSPHQFGRGNWRVSSVNAAYYSVGPAAGVNATIVDMSRWVQANLGAFPEVLPRSLLDMQHAPVVETASGNYFNRWPRLQKAYYGLGWRVMDYAGVRVIHHGGGVRGYRSELVLIPEYDLGLVVMFNAETPLANDVVPQFLDTLLTTVNLQ